MPSFSERLGLTTPRTLVQLDSMDDPLRNGLWSALVTHFYKYTRTDQYSYSPRPEVFPLNELKYLLRQYWLLYFKRPVDTIPSDWQDAYESLRKHFFAAKWFEVYDFIEFSSDQFPKVEEKRRFQDECNSVLKREMSAYRFVTGVLTRLTDPAEVDAVSAAQALPSRFAPVNSHIATALAFLSDKKNPDYRNSIKESISAVEAMSALITGQERSDLASALKVLEQKAQLHCALRSAFTSLYGYTSDSNGIRHALLEENNLTFEDAKFMLVACSAFVNYLKSLTAE